MSRDKYSDSHTISVDEGNGTLVVDGNLEVSGSLSQQSVDLNSSITQVLRIPGISFRPRTPSDFSNVTYPTSPARGRVEFSSTPAKVQASIEGLPHGVTITGFRFVGAATGASDNLDVDLKRINGSIVTNLVSKSYNNEVVGTVDETTALSETIDYSLDYFYIIEALGSSSTTSSRIEFIDILYSIQKFPQDATSTPS